MKSSHSIQDPHHNPEASKLPRHTRKGAELLSEVAAGAVAALAAIKDTTDVFPPLKSAAATVLLIIESAQVRAVVRR